MAAEPDDTRCGLRACQEHTFSLCSVSGAQGCQVPAISIEVEPPCVRRGLLLQHEHSRLRMQLHIFGRQPSLKQRDPRTNASNHSRRQDHTLQLSDEPASDQSATDTYGAFAAMTSGDVEGNLKESLYVGFTNTQSSRPFQRHQ